MSVTGNNRHPDTPLSIRLSADGLSFYASGASVPAHEFVTDPTETTCDLLEKLRLTERIDFNAFSSAIIEVDTDRMVLAPLEAFEEGMQEHFLALNNIPVTTRDAVVVASPTPAIITIMVVPRDVVTFCQGIWGEHNVRFASPIGHCLHHGLQRTLRLFLARDFAYMALYGDKLEVARAIPYRSPADLLYHMLPLRLHHTQIRVLGRHTKPVVAQLRRYLSRVSAHAHR